MFANLLITNQHDLVTKLLFCSFDACAVLLSLVVVLNYLLSKRTKSRYSSMYCLMLVLTVCASIFDAAYLLTKHVFELPSAVHDTFAILFYLTYITVGIVFFIYAVSVIYDNLKIPRIWYVLANGLFIAGLCGIVLAAVYCYADIDYIGGVESKYLYESVINGVVICSLISAMAVTIKNNKRLKTHHRINVYMFLALNCAAVLMQMLIEHFHVSCFALSIAMLLLYITLQRPESSLDAVSGMFNAAVFGKNANDRITAGKHFLVFTAEIDNMGVVNSTFGMHGGNTVLREAAVRIKNHLDKEVYLYRLGGARFAVIFDDWHTFKKFEPKYLTVFDTPFDINGSKMRMSATACLIAYPEVGEKVADVDEIMKYYRTSAKTSDTILVADKEVLEHSRRRHQVDYAVQRAVKNRTFQVYYQPIYSVKNDKINACEALIRLNDPDLGFIPPDEFIPVAEQTGRIVEVGKIVMEEVCRFLSEQKPQDYGIEFVDVNLSVIQCMHPEIVDDIDAILRKYGIARDMVNLEVTETASAQSYALLQSRLNELHQSGFTISLDDFGTGFSSVEYLINFPFDVVKLDKSLVWAYMSTKKYEPILKHYMPMLHSLGTKIVAEGVETIEMVKALEELGCDYLQGYYFSKPIPEQAFMEFVISGKVKAS